MNRLLPYLVLISLLCTLVFSEPATAGKAGSKPITITLPATTLHKTLSDMLPLPIELKKKNSKFQGTVVIDSISRLAVAKNRISVSGRLTGRKLMMQAKVGNQTIQIKLGKLVLPVTCDLALRFAPAKKTLFLFPKFQQPADSKSNADQTVVSLLNSLSREYPLPLDELTPLVWDMGSKQVSLYLDPVDIRAEKNTLILKLRSTTGKQP